MAHSIYDKHQHCPKCAAFHLLTKDRKQQIEKWE